MLAYFLVQDPEENLTHGFTANTTDKVFGHSYPENDLGILHTAPR